MTMRTLTTIDTAAIGDLQRRGLIVGAIGAVVGGLGVVLHPDQFMPSWLIGFLFFTGLSLGCLALLMLQHMSGGQWGLVSRRIFEVRYAAAAAGGALLHPDRDLRAEAVSLGAS